MAKTKTLRQDAHDRSKESDKDCTSNKLDGIVVPEHRHSDEPASKRIREMNTSTELKAQRKNWHLTKSETNSHFEKTVDDNTNAGRNVRSETLRDRMEMIFGTDKNELMRAIHTRIAWNRDICVPNQKNFTDIVYPDSNLLALPQGTCQIIFPEKLIPKSAIIINDHKLEPNESRVAKGVVLLNSGNFVTSIKWAPGRKGKQLLAVGLLAPASGMNSLDSPAYREDIALISKNCPSSELIFYEIDFQAAVPVVDVFCSIFSRYGAVLQLVWRPVNNSKELLMICQDGSAIIVIVKDRGLLEFSENAFRIQSESKTKFTAGVWRDVNTVVLAAADGTISEYFVADECEENIYRPSFVVPIHSSTIVDIQSAYPQHPELLLTSSVDGYAALVNIANLHQGVAYGPRGKLYSNCSAWCPQVESFISLEDPVTSRLYFIRSPSLQQNGTSLTSHSSMITALAASAVHPFVLSGGIDGGLHIANAVRRAMVTRRNGRVCQEAVIWTLELSDQTSHLRFVENNQIQDPNISSRGTDHIVIFQKASTITSLDWCPSTKFGGWYAAGTASGLIRIENLS